MAEPIVPPQETLAWKNRRLMAQRLPYPAGALDSCERFDRDHPFWSASWMPPNLGRGSDRPAGFGARRTDYVRLRRCDDFRRGEPDDVPRQPWAFGETIDALEHRVAEMEALIAAEAELSRRLGSRIQWNARFPP
ncbi:hypothetical protein Q0Z83_042640 [Actinoplanes sichuanensis]|uniref:Uncharacterized protein n=1 Tax=Actinoplanes sichuanensis TaxID=512349 RepID=A0ABW4A8B1_9ACTN|nr:hypothetical protein [Actinoplanes sichuanensis]BEL06073.1 hypothetical protein Q0Z83_042640 [Actinoplanes sichuanensis]